METRKASLIEILWGLTKIRFNTHRAYWVYTVLMKFSCLLQRCRITVLLVGCTLSLLDLSSPTRDWTQAGYSQWGHRVRYNLVTEHRHIAAKSPSPKHWTAREFPRMVVFNHSSFDQVVQVYPDFIYFDNKLVCKYPLLLLCTTCEIYEGICTLVSTCLDMKSAWMTNTSLLLMCKSVKSESEVAQSCPTLCNPMDCSLPGSSVHGISQQEYWNELLFPSSGDLPDPGICIGRQILYHWATWGIVVLFCPGKTKSRPAVSSVSPLSLHWIFSESLCIMGVGKLMLQMWLL